MKKNFIILAACAVLSACAADVNNKTLIVLQHPTTKETKECRGDAWTTWNVYAEVEACAKAYEKAGFKRLGSY
jgi:ABC-type uncharacterized transport system auxiliary subunit